MKKLPPEEYDFILHFTPQNVIESRVYKKFVDSQPNGFHIKLNESNNYSSLKTVFELQTKLNEIDASVFPSLRWVFKSFYHDSLS